MNDQLTHEIARGLMVLCAAAVLSACNDEDTRFAQSIAAVEQTFSIAGKPGGSVVQNTQYDFQPQVNSPESAELTFSITGKPEWASFKRRDGRLSGVPTEADVGMTHFVQITVSDGFETVMLPGFDLAVVAYGTEQVTLGWQPPTSNVDGTPLMDLNGHRIYWGTIEGEYPNAIEIDNPGLATFVVDNLVPNTYYFVTTALNSSGMESDHSNVARAIVN